MADNNLNINHILEGGGTLVVALDGNDRRKHTFCLDFLETIAQLVKVVDTGFFHKTDIVGMMRHAHAVTFVIFHFVLVSMHNSELISGIIH